MASTFQQPQPILLLNMPQFHYLHNYSNMMVGDQPIQVRDNDYHHHAGGGMISLSSQEGGGGKHYGDGGSYTSATTSSSSSSSSSSGSSYSSSEESSAAEEEAQGHASVAPSTTSSTKTPGGLSVYRFDDSVLCAVSELGDVAPTLTGQDEEDDDDQLDHDVHAYMNNTDDDGTECAFANMSVYERDDTTVSTMTTTTRAVPRPVMRIYAKDDDTAVSSISGVMSHLAIATTTSTPTNTTMIKSSDYSRVSSGLSTVPGGETTAASSSSSSSSSHSKSTKNNMTYLQSILEIGDADAGRPLTPTSSSKRKKDKSGKMTSSSSSTASSIASSSLAPPKKKKSGLLRRLFPTTAPQQQV